MIGHMTVDSSPNNIHLCRGTCAWEGGGGGGAGGLHLVCEPLWLCCDDGAALEHIWFRVLTETRGLRRHLEGWISLGFPLCSFVTECQPVDFLKRLLSVLVGQRRNCRRQRPAG